MAKTVVTDIFHVMDFGKHKTKTVGEVFEDDPGWLLWAHNNVQFFSLSPDLHEQVLRQIDAQKKAKKAKVMTQIKEKGLIGTPGKAVSVQELFGKVLKDEVKGFNPEDPDDGIPF